MKEYKNRISTLRNKFKKSTDQDLIDHVFKKLLPEIFNFYIENYINPNNSVQVLLHPLGLWLFERHIKLRVMVM